MDYAGFVGINFRRFGRAISAQAGRGVPAAAEWG